MEKNQPRKIKNRDSLYDLFLNGKRPVQDDFHDLIDSTLNKLDDGISKDFENGLQLAPQKIGGQTSGKLISFYEQLDGSNPIWIAGLNGEKNNRNLYFKFEPSEIELLTLTRNKTIGVNNSQPKYEFDVNGTIGMTSRRGTYAEGSVRANGEWHTILRGLKTCNIFEITAIANGLPGKGMYATMHAIASNAYSGKRGRIHCRRDYYSWKWWRRLRLRWTGTPFNYDLQIKTCSDFGSEGEINFNVCQLSKSQNKATDDTRHLVNK